jgi:predicted P-loop ATPase
VTTIELGEPLQIGRGDRPAITIDNCARVLAAIHEQIGTIRYDDFTGRIVLASEVGAFLDHPEGEEWSDVHTTALVRRFEQLSPPLEVSPGTVDRAVEEHARRHRFNALTEFVLSCAEKWDGVARVDTALEVYWGAPDTEATRITSRVWLLSLAARALIPGCKQDVCPYFSGAQGEGKSTALERLVGAEWFSDSPLPIGDKDAQQNIRGVWGWEIGENAAIGKREAAAVKGFLSQRSDRFRPSYGRGPVTVPRQTCFAATINPDGAGFLRDSTGERRFPVVEVGTIDLAGITRDREQLIGEAATRVMCGIVDHPEEATRPAEYRWWITAPENAVLDTAREPHEERDPWTEPIADWAAKRFPSGGPLNGGKFAKPKPFTIDDVLSDRVVGVKRVCEVPEPVYAGAVPLPAARRDKRVQGRVAIILRALGYKKVRDQSRGPQRGRYLWHAP